MNKLGDILELEQYKNIDTGTLKMRVDRMTKILGTNKYGYAVREDMKYKVECMLTVLGRRGWDWTIQDGWTFQGETIDYEAWRRANGR